MMTMMTATATPTTPTTPTTMIAAMATTTMGKWNTTAVFGSNSHSAPAGRMEYNIYGL